MFLFALVRYIAYITFVILDDLLFIFVVYLAVELMRFLIAYRSDILYFDARALLLAYFSGDSLVDGRDRADRLFSVRYRIIFRRRTVVY